MAYPVPFLVFADKRGLELPRFNTIRLGASWSKKVKKGDRVLLGFKNEIIGAARVVSVAAGPVHDMLREHAAGNHIELALAAEHGADYQAALAPHRRLESMRRNYGPHKVTDTVTITVIELAARLERKR